MELKNRKEAIDQMLMQYFEPNWVNGILSFAKPDGTIFRIAEIAGLKALVVEFAENLREAIVGRFEDGDLFYLDEMDEQTMFCAMLAEISPENTLQTGLSLYQLQEAVENILEYADELLSEGKENLDLVQKGQLIGIAEALQILQENMTQESREKVGLDFNVEEKYLY